MKIVNIRNEGQEWNDGEREKQRESKYAPKLTRGEKSSCINGIKYKKKI